jgi:uncharacterized protein YjbI with pentapeptide repeats
MAGLGWESGKRAVLSHAQLQGLSLWSADPREADLSYANLPDAHLDHARCEALVCGMRRWRRPLADVLGCRAGTAPYSAALAKADGIDGETHRLLKRA